MARFLYTLPWAVLFAAAMIAVAAIAWRKWPEQELAGIFARIGLSLAPLLWLHAIIFYPPRNWFLSDGIVGFAAWFSPRRKSVFDDHTDKAVGLLGVALVLIVGAVLASRSLRHARGSGWISLVLFAAGAAYLWQIPYELLAVRLSLSEVFAAADDTTASLFDRELLMPLVQGVSLTLGGYFLLRHSLPQKEPERPSLPVDERRKRRPKRPR